MPIIAECNAAARIPTTAEECISIMLPLKSVEDTPAQDNESFLFPIGDTLFRVTPVSIGKELCRRHRREPD